ncbi:MAG: shikimate dehydrogenase [Sodalis sp. (in: enterobacteria)]
MDAFAVFGNPIKHSWSPRIYALFADEIGLSHSYGLVLAPLTEFKKTLRRFFDAGGLGANITSPFKESACLLCDHLSERGSLAGAVNTIKKQQNGLLFGDNTDGIGLFNDLQRLDLLCHDSRVLLVGAGGAARGVILPLLAYGCKIVLTNRTFSRAQELAGLYHHISDITAQKSEYLDTFDYDLIINATSIGMSGGIPSLPTSIIRPEVCCYDMFYQKGDTPFIAWCRRQGAKRCADGLGMLVGQAAWAFLLWHGLLPSISPVIETLRMEMSD